MTDLRRRTFCGLISAITLVGPMSPPALQAEEPLMRLLAQSDDARSPGPQTTSGGEEVRTAAINEVPSEHPLLKPISFAEKSLTKLQAVNDYEATFVKQERVGGKLVNQRMQIRLRERPFSVYLLYSGDQAGREIMYVQGKNNNQIYAHEGSGLKSLIGTVSLATDGVEAMQENRYPITMIGMRRMLETILSQWQEETKYGEVHVNFYPEAKLGGRPCNVIESIHPQQRRQFKFHMTRLFIDAETRLPVRVEQYGFPAMPGAQPPLEEEYTYSGIRINVGLGDRDFNPHNDRYNF